MNDTFDGFELAPTFFNDVYQRVQSVARKLEIAVFEHLFRNGSSKQVIEELQRYQNEDGGFGQGLEPDFLLPDSSPIATSRAFQILNKLPESEEKKKMIKKAVIYLHKSYNKIRHGWYTVPKSVNDYPHAPWWHWDEDTQQTVIDSNWGNPSAELLGYLLKYDKKDGIDLATLTEYALHNLKGKTEYTSAFEIYCYIRLYHFVSETYQEQFKPLIKTAVTQLVETDPDKWIEYVPQPLDFLFYPSDTEDFWGIPVDIIEKNIRYRLIEIKEEGIIKPSWEWGVFIEEWKSAKLTWSAILTIETLERFEQLGIK